MEDFYVTFLYANSSFSRQKGIFIPWHMHLEWIGEKMNFAGENNMKINLIFSV